MRADPAGAADGAGSGPVNEPCIFCAIAAGRVPAHIVYSDAEIVAFLDRGPIRPGHLLIVPHAHVEAFEALPAGLAAKVLEAGQRLARAQKRLYGVDRVAFMFSGGDVPHTHAHLVPMVDKTDITSRRYIAETELTFRLPPTPPEAEMAATAREIAALLEA
jgi:histidine triad (HIT) family protein